MNADASLPNSPSGEPLSTVQDLQTLYQIGLTLNRATDVVSVLSEALALLMKVIGLESAWIFLKDENAASRWAGRGYRLAAHHGLPPALALDNAAAWDKSCDCQALCNQNRLLTAYNEVRCSRLASAQGERRGLAVHASVPLRSGQQTLGILNVAAPDWNSFSERSLALLTNVGNQMGIALERAELYDMLQAQRLHEQAILLDFTNQLLSRRRLPELMEFLAEEVRRLIQVDACAILMPDAEDQGYLRFVAASGWSHDPVASGRRVPMDETSGSGRAMMHQEPVVQADITLTDRLPWMREWLAAEQFRSAAIIPLIVNGRSTGTLVVDSRQPQQLSPEDLRFLQLMANQAALAIETRRLHEEELARQRMEEELEFGRRIQLSMLPPATPHVPGWEFSAYYRAARQVGGDFYDFYRLAAPGYDRRARLGILIADVADKGVPAALFMALSRTTLRNVTHTVQEPAAALKAANNLILEDSHSDLFLTVFYGVLETGTGQLAFTNAGHNPPILRRRSGEIEMLQTPGMALGIVPDAELAGGQVQLQAGDILVLYTDGVTEAVASDMSEFGVAGILQALEDVQEASAAVVLNRIIDAVEQHVGEEIQHDDFTLLVAQRPSVEASSASGGQIAERQ